MILFAKWCPGAESNHQHEDFQLKLPIGTCELATPTLTALTPIYTNLAVQYQMCVVPVCISPNATMHLELGNLRPEAAP